MSHLLVGRRSDGHRNYVDALTTTDHSSIEQYLQEKAMNHDGTWESSIEIATLSHLLAAPIYVYDVSHEVHRWTAYFPSTIDTSLTRSINCMSLYIYFTGNHFNVVTSVSRQ